MKESGIYNYCEKCQQDPNLVASIKDTINPTHYKSHPSGVECITITQWFNFNKGNAIKYIWRAGEKNKTTECEDLKKAIWYLSQEIERIAGK